MMDDSKKLDTIVVEPLRKPVNFSLAVPGSKSIANRAILLAGFAEGRSTLREVPESDDIKAALSVLLGLGVSLSNPAPGHWEISGNGMDVPVREGEIRIGSSGTVGRFLPGLLAAVPSGNWRLTATEQLSRRPLSPLLQALGQWGAVIRREEPGTSFPLNVLGNGLPGGKADISATMSSQFASGLMLAGPLCRDGAGLNIRDLDPEERYIDMTRAMMRRFGVESRVDVREGAAKLEFSPQTYRAADVTVEADFNSANYFLALPLLTGGAVAVTNLSAGSEQPGRKFLEVLSLLGGTVEETPYHIRVTGEGLPLHGGFDIDMRAMSEMAPTLGVLAAFADWPITMRNLAHIRGHETDRLKAMKHLLGLVGVKSDIGPDWLRVHPFSGKPARATIDSLDDHRLAMSFALLGLAGEGLAITNPGAVAKTFPDFFRRLALAGAEIRPA